jgi:hypothetical protein
VYGKLIGDKPSALSTLVCVEPTQIPVEGVCAARIISKVHIGKRDKQRQEIYVPVNRTQIATHEFPSPHCDQEEARSEQENVSSQDLGTMHLVLANFRDEELTITKATTLGTAQEISEQLLIPFKEPVLEETSTENTFTTNENKQAISPKFRNYLDEKLGHISSAERKYVEPVLIRYLHIFHNEESDEFKGTDLVEHQILTAHLRLESLSTEFHLLSEKRWIIKSGICLKREL